MNVPLMRKGLQDALRSVPATPHAGLWLSRGWKAFTKTKGDEERGGKTEHLAVLCRQRPSALYEQAYKRWQTATCDTTRFRALYVRLSQRLFIGLSSASALETGVCTSHSYGMPMIPGSSVKGAVRAHAQAMGVPAAYLAALFGENEASAASAGRTPGAASLVWHDAWWIPEVGVSPFVQEVVTVHHQQYYAGQGEATDFDSPVPNAQVAVQGSFHFVVEGDPAWAKIAVDLLQSALAGAGIGAKRAAGYGFMALDTRATQKAEREQREALKQSLGPADKIRLDLQALDEKKLAERFGTGINATRTEYSDEEWALVREIGMEVRGELIRSWSTETKKTNKAKAKAYKFFLGLKGDD